MGEADRGFIRTAMIAVAVFALAYLVFVCTSTGQVVDNRIWALTSRIQDRQQRLLSEFARQQMTWLAVASVLAWCLLRRAWFHAFAAPGITAACALGCHLLRSALPRPFLGDNGGFPINSFPSTHVALAVTPLIYLALLVRTRSLLGWFCWAGVAVAWVGNTVLHVHRASDSLGSIAIAVALCALLLSIHERRKTTCILDAI